MVSPISIFGADVCALITASSALIGWWVGLMDGETLRGLRGAIKLTALTWLCLFIGAVLADELSRALLLNLCADRSIPCLQFGSEL